MESFKVKEAAKNLGITTSTIKKYYLIFEHNNFTFRRDKNGQLLFSEEDLELFKKLIDLKNKPGMNVQKAVEQLLKERGIYNTNDVSFQLSFMIKEINELKQMVANQHQTIEKLREQLEKMEEKGEVRTRKKLEEFERDLIYQIKSSINNWQKESNY